MVKGKLVMKLFNKILTSLVAVNLLLVLALAAHAQTSTPPPSTLTKAERDQIVKYLKDTKEMVVKSTKGLSEEQMNFKPAPNRWSVKEVVQHLALAEDFLFGLIQNQVMKTPETPDKRAAAAGLEKTIMEKVPDRTSKFQAPEPIQPTDAKAPGDPLALFKTRRDNTIKFVKQTKENLRVHFMDTPGMGAADAWQWFFFLGAHSHRHNKQIEEVKADPNFPKK